MGNKILISQEQLPEVLRLIDLGIPLQRVAKKFGTSHALILQIKVLRGLPDYDVNHKGPSKLCKTYAMTKKYADYEEKGTNKLQRKLSDNLRSNKQNRFAKITILF